jgi:pentatricopeptide repeat protein
MLTEVTHHFSQQGNGLMLTAPGYGSLIKAYGQARDVVRVRELWQEMRKHGVNATAVTVGCMVDALVTNECVEEAWDLVREVHSDEESRPLVNTVIYSTILKGFAQRQRVVETFKVFEEMEQLGIPSNTITYNTIINACARCGAMSRVPPLLTSMRAGYVEPDLVTYSTLVKGYCHAGDVSRAFKVLEEMKASGQHQPDEIMYNSLLDGCAKQHCSEEALKLLEDMQAAGVAPSNYTLSILVKLLGRERKLDKAFEMVEGLSGRHGFKPNVQVYTCLIQACLQNRRIDRAMAIHDAMIANSRCCPDEKMYSVLVRGCLQANAMDQTVRALRSAYQLSGGASPSSNTTRRSCQTPGVEDGLLAEAMGRLRSASPAHREAAQALAADLKAQHGLGIENDTHSDACAGKHAPMAAKRSGVRVAPRGRRV